MSSGISSGTICLRTAHQTVSSLRTASNRRRKPFVDFEYHTVAFFDEVRGFRASTVVDLDETIFDALRNLGACCLRNLFRQIRI